MLLAKEARTAGPSRAKLLFWSNGRCQTSKEVCCVLRASVEELNWF